MTASEVNTTVFAFAAGAVYILIGAIFFEDESVVRFLWVIATFFVIFYALSVMADYVAAARFGYMKIITTPLWDQHLPGNDRVEGTLWAVAAVGGASLITLLLELAFAQFGRGDAVVRSTAEELESVEILLAAYGEDRSVAESAAKNIRRLDMVGTSRLRRYLERSTHSPQYREQMGAVVALAGRLIDLAASLEYVAVTLDDQGRKRARDLAENISSIRTAIVNGRIPQTVEPHRQGAEDAAPLFREMEITVGLIPKAFTGSEAITAYSPQTSREEQSRGFLVPDAFTNPEHIQFGLKGCLAASLCYIACNALFWPGISTAVTTCFLTALTTVGASHQKQLLRVAGAVVGGFGLGMGAQIFILPYLDSIAAFTVLFLPVAAISAWFATSSPRLSYFGVQIAVAFFLINVSEF
jgi:multidrug resistance protein MdtO